MRTKEEWLQYIYTEANEKLIYMMDDMQFPELNSLITSGVIYQDSYDPLGYNMPKWISDNKEFSLYNRMFCILKIGRLWNFGAEKKGEKKLKGVRVRIMDIDDGDNDYGIDTEDQKFASETIEFFKNEFENDSILDAAKLKYYLLEKGFKRW